MGPCLSKEPQYSKFVCTVGGQLILQYQKKERTKCRDEKGGNKSGKLTATTMKRKVEKDLMRDPGPGSFGKEKEGLTVLL